MSPSLILLNDLKKIRNWIRKNKCLVVPFPPYQCQQVLSAASPCLLLHFPLMEIRPPLHTERWWYSKLYRFIHLGCCMLKAHGSCSIPLMLIPLSSDGNQTSTAHREMVIFQGSNNLVFLHMYIVYIVLSWEDQPFTSFSLRKIIVFVQIVNCIVLIVCWFSVFFWNYAAIVFIWDSLSVSVHCPWYLAKLKIVFDQI